MINPGSTIPQLLKIVTRTFRECDFNEVQEILMDCEKMMKFEIQELQRDLDSMKTELRLQERSCIVTEMEKSRIEEKLQISRRKCEELNEKITRLTEEHKFCNEFSKMMSEKDKLILELNGKINELQTKNLENEQLLGKYKQQSESLEAEVAILRVEKLASDQLVVELRQKQSVTDQAVVELERQNWRATKKMDEMRQEKVESESRPDDLAPRVFLRETGLANLLKVKVDDLSFTGKFSRSWKESLETDTTDADAENVGTSSSGAGDDTPMVMKGIIVFKRNYELIDSGFNKLLGV